MPFVLRCGVRCKLLGFSCEGQLRPGVSMVSLVSISSIILLRCASSAASRPARYRLSAPSRWGVSRRPGLQLGFSVSHQEFRLPDVAGAPQERQVASKIRGIAMPPPTTRASNLLKEGTIQLISLPTPEPPRSRTRLSSWVEHLVQVSV